MQFLKTLFWVAIAVALVLFASVNWKAVEVTLWGGLLVDIKLPVLVFAAFLIGFLPMLIYHRARMWTVKRRLEGYERQVIAPAPVVTVPDTASAVGGSDPIAAPAPSFDPELPVDRRDADRPIS
jgi:putative membrane protein